MRLYAERFVNGFRKGLSALLTFVFALGGLAHANVNDNTAYSTGLKVPTEEQLEEIKQNWPHVVGVRTNKVGLHRINEYMGANNVRAENIPVASSPEDEFITVIGEEASRQPLALQTLDPTVLPRHVDNSQLPSFPAIGNQGSNGSCAAWGSTYYHMSHEIGMLNGVNNKVSKEGVLSPKWTYNLLNGGGDNGLEMFHVYEFLEQQGAPSILKFPYDGDFLAWDLNPQDWVDALNNRFTPPQVVPAETPDQLQLIKQILNNGHVFTVGTWAYSWQMTTVKADPASTSNPYAGQQAISWLKGRAGGHCVTIVGYDDDVWIDINGNGTVDPGEKGAFLFANSWGTTWGNNGLMWVSYDAFRRFSNVAGAPSTDRVPMADITDGKLIGANPKGLHYKPSLIAQFALNQTLRNQILIWTGVSNTSQSFPSAITVMDALKNGGGAYEFDGKNPQTVTSATFVSDLTDLIASNQTANLQRFYLQVSDNRVGNTTTLLSYSLIDVVRGNQVDCPGLPATCDNSILTKFIDYDTHLPVPTDRPSVSITSPTNGSAVKDMIQVVVQATSNIGISHVDFYVNGTLVQTDTNAPYLFSVDTRQLTGTQATFKAIAFDQKQQQADASVTVTLNNAPALPTSYQINAGGLLVNDGTTLWSADQFFQGQSTSATSVFSFINPLYRTQRVGNFSYNFPIQNGNYLVVLKFGEFSAQNAGRRTFDVIINSHPVITNLSLLRVAGFARPYDRAFAVPVTNNNINIYFAPGNGDAVINGISITPR